MSGPLAGLRVLDLTTVVLGPYATQILGDFGADVIKIERPGGDPSRYMSPGRSRGMSGIAMNLHRNKRSIVLDLKQDGDRDVFRKLVKKSDVVVHNMLPPVVAALDISYDSLRRFNPALVYCAATGFADGGPYAGKPAYDDLIQGASGLVGLMESASGEMRYFPGIICDKVTGLAVVNAVLAAIVHRERSGEGQEITVPMFETMLSFNLVEHVADALFDPARSDFGYGRVLSPDRKPYRTKDGHICALPYSDRDWQAFFRIIGRTDLSEDPRFADMSGRTAHIDELYALIASALQSKSTSDWLLVFEAENIPVLPIMNVADLESDPQVTATGFLKRRVHPTEGAFKEIGIPVEFSATSPETPVPAPVLNQHRDEILREFFGDGYDDR